MKICLINGSPKRSGSCSEYLVQTIEGNLSQACQVRRIKVPAGWEKSEEAVLWNELQEAERIVLVFPLYVDGIPSHLLEFLMQWEGRITRQSNAGQEQGPGQGTGQGLVHIPEVYAVINCGFYEGRQNSIALDMVRLFCESVGFRYRYGLGIGGGPFIGEMSELPWSSPLKRKAGQALSALAAELSRAAAPVEAEDFAAAVSGPEITKALPTAGQCDNQYVEPGMPRFFYLTAGNLQWWKPARKNGETLRGMFVKKKVDMASLSNRR